MLIASPTGSGKTSAVIKMIKHTSMPVIYVTNRKMTLCQFKKDYIKASKGLDVPAELLDSISLGENIIAITYQELAETTYKYKGKNTSSYLTKSIVCWKMLISQCTQRKLFGI